MKSMYSLLPEHAERLCDDDDDDMCVCGCRLSEPAGGEPVLVHPVL